MSDPVDAVDVYLRDGCPYCSRLMRHLRRSGVVVRTHDIWADDDARRFVRAHNRGNETVPTVDVGGVVSTNPDPGELVAGLTRDHPHLVDGTADRDGAGGWWQRVAHGGSGR